MADVRATAQLFAKPVDRHDTDGLTVLFTEERDRPLRQRLAKRKIPNFDRPVVNDLLVDQFFDRMQLLFRESLRVCEVET
ncbi:hypothetical protein HRbin27_00496 [bacterium HR27]|nr:hypothetical protein HRbin27_00496 [bacterium HR27]